MKTLTTFLILAISLSFAGCATMEAGSGSTSATPAVSSGATDGKMLTQEDYDRIGVKETEDLRR